ncbi:hypothetical protein DVK85_08045 [Flavobacterium arcticum]|uniref:DUF3078 domain-containing protein n=1 Tax=Flavobacterium arcticum TaxID=1784713 RepID=A0A345HC81_9FLAO|nr:hypothetical protein [Flavobacterium arcticum]AXG74191.1 hypothetical protein DVK85_08045 [Flavobacterium arcticum]KAF2508221.1 hypothetical protein E0W72_11250 [Flavobacterium arcticum]
MKTKITLLLLLVYCAFYGQIPSVNPTFKGNKALNPFNLKTNGASFIEKINDDSISNDEDLINQDTKGYTIADYSYYIDSYTLTVDKYRDSISAYEKKRFEVGKESATILTDSIKANRARLIALRAHISKLRKEKNKKIRLFPSWDQNNKMYFFQEFYDEDNIHTNYLNNVSLLFDNTTVQSELLSDYLGPFRLAFGTVINANSDKDDEATEEDSSEITKEEQQDELQRIINGGGNFYLNAQLPVHAYTSTNFLEIISLNGRFSSDIEGVGSDVEATDVKYGVNASAYLALTTDQKKFGFFVNAEYGWISGTNNFRDDFGLQKVFDKPAFWGKVVVGIMLNSKVTISITSKSISNYDSLLSDKVMVGIQLLN